MGIESLHPEYKEHSTEWERCADVFSGEDAVKARGVTYLPSLGPINTVEDKQDYEAYKTRAGFVNMLEPTIRGIVGLILSRDPVVTMDKTLLEKIEDDMTLKGTSMREWIRDMVVELLKSGRVQYLVDYDRKLNRPYVTPYNALQYTNWSDDWHLLKECYLVAGEDRYDQKDAVRYRELERTPKGVVANVYQKIKVQGEEKWSKIKTVPFLIRGKAVTEFPFVIASASGDLCPCKPPLMDLVNVNLSHYRTSADLEHGRHFTALPTPWTTGLDPDDPKNKEIRIGSMAAWLLPQGSSCGFLEFTGAGLSALAEAKKEKAAEAAALGAQMLMEPQKQAETAETARIHASGKTATLHDLVLAAEAAAEEVLEWMLRFDGAQNPEVEVKLNRQFFSAKLNPQELTALKDLFVAGTISYEVFFFNLQNGLVMPPERTMEEEKQAIEDEAAPEGEIPKTKVDATGQGKEPAASEDNGEDGGAKTDPPSGSGAPAGAEG